MGVFICTTCCFRCPSWRAWLRHTFEAHSSEPSFNFTCGINGCTSSFRLFSSISSHLSRKHYSHLDGSNTVNITAEPSNDDNDCDMNVPVDNSTIEIEPENLSGGSDDCDMNTPVNNFSLCPTIDTEPQNLSGGSKRSSALFLLTLKERYRLTQTAVDFAVSQVGCITDHIVQDIHYSVQCKLQQHFADHTQIPDLTDCFTVANPFEGLENEYKQIKFYKEHFNLIEPITIKLGTRVEYVNTGPNRRLSEVADTFQYVPLLEGLKALLSHSDIHDEVLRQRCSSTNLITDYCDGKLYKSHELFSADATALQLIFYFDEIEVCNPLGGQNGIHKLGIFYYTIGNMRPELRSSQRAIQLVACVYSAHINTYGLESIFHPMISDINKLAKDGIVIPGHDAPLRGTVLLFLADTIAAHQLGGFKIPGGAFRKCRDCNATQSLINSKFTEEDFNLRTPSTYDRNCERLENGTIPEYDSVTYGLNYRSPLNEIEFFHVTKSLPQDIMHILFEGVIPLETKLMLKAFIWEKAYFTLDFLNERMRSFSYGKTESQSKPPKPLEMHHIKSSGSKIHLSASQMWTLARYLPLIIGDKIDSEDPMWECYLLLLEITMYCTARIISVSSINYVKVLIQQHHQAFRECYPGVNMTPKIHYMVHFPRLMEHVGPLVNSWCMRMESKNSYVKQAAQVGRNYKNVPYSVAMHHQKLMCGYLQSNKFFSYDELQCGPCQESSINLLDDDPLKEDILHKLPETSLLSTISRPKWIKIYGQEYHQSCFINTGWQDDDDLPIFGKSFSTSGINSHILSYEIEPTYNDSLINLSNLQNIYW